MIKVWADFNANSENGLYLNCKGTIDDLARQKIELKDGMELILWNQAETRTVKYSPAISLPGAPTRLSAHGRRSIAER